MLLIYIYIYIYIFPPSIAVNGGIYLTVLTLMH